VGAWATAIFWLMTYSVAPAQEIPPSHPSATAGGQIEASAPRAAVSPTNPPPAAETPPAPQPSHAFWDRGNVFLFSGVAAMRALDYASTRNFLARGRQEILLPQDVVENSPAFASIEVAGIATSVGISYCFHRTGHHTMERWVSIMHIGVTGFGDARNYALKSKHPK
jgi:hypothetical protein